MTIQDVYTVMRELESRLSGQIVTFDDLSGAFSFYFPDIDREILEVALQKLEQGLREGEEEFGRLFNLGQEEQSQETLKRLSWILDTLPESQQRQRIFLWYQVLSQDSGYRIEGTVSRYLTHMSTEELKEGICFLLWRKGQELAGSALSRLAETAKGCGISETDVDTEEMLFAAAVYVVMQKSSLSEIPAKQIGQQIGFQKAFFKGFKRTFKEEEIPEAMRFLEVIFLAVGAYFWLQLFLINETVLFVITYTEKNHLWKLAAPAAFSAIFFGGSQLFEQLLTDPVGYWMQGQAEDARSEADQYFAQITVRAEQFEQENNMEFVTEPGEFRHKEQTVELEVQA